MRYLFIILIFVCSSVSAQRINYGILPTIDSISATDYFPALRAPNNQYKSTYQSLINLLQDSITGSPTWGSITGDLDTQSDLYTALNLKLNISDTSAMIKRDTSSVYLISDATTSSTTAVATNLKFQIGANQRYFVMVDGTAAKATSVSGLKLAVGAPSGCTIKGYQQSGGSSLSTAMTNSLLNAINTLGSTFATGIGVEVPFRMVFTVTNGANAGVIELQFATVTSNTATIFAGTNIRWQRTKGL
jgi:hypothetical protein